MNARLPNLEALKTFTIFEAAVYIFCNSSSFAFTSKIYMLYLDTGNHILNWFESPSWMQSKVSVLIANFNTFKKMQEAF